MQDFAIGRTLDSPSALYSSPYVLTRYLAHAAAQIESAIGVQSPNVRAADADDNLVDVGARSPLRLFVRGLHRFRCRTEIGNEALAHTGGFNQAVPAIAQRSLVDVSRKHARPGAACIQYYDQVVFGLVHLFGQPVVVVRCGFAMPFFVVCFAAFFAEAFDFATLDFVAFAVVFVVVCGFTAGFLA